MIEGDRIGLPGSREETARIPFAISSVTVQRLPFDARCVQLARSDRAQDLSKSRQQSSAMWALLIPDTIPITCEIRVSELPRTAP
ncbi:hypothetical protein NL676_035970 [Syzygium grande]|nr:hypothetical protein NL676_035970 [Syzygium grande]